MTGLGSLDCIRDPGKLVPNEAERDEAFRLNLVDDLRIPTWGDLLLPPW